MSNIKLVHSGGNSVSLTTPDSNPAANRTFKLPGADGSSGQFLKTDGSGALSFASAPVGGITHAVTYRLESSVTISGSAIDPVTPWKIADNSFDGKLEDSNTWSAPSSGIFSFPVTGIYSIDISIMMSQVNDSNAWCGIELQITTNNGTSYAGATKIYNQIVQASGSSTQYTNAHTQAIIDVTDISQTKYKISFYSDQNESVKLNGASDDNRTSIKVIRLGDT